MQIQKTKSIFNGKELFDLKIENIPALIEPIIPKIGLIALVGTSDIGKSTLLLQLCTDLALNEEFIGFKIKPATRNSIYVSTEDDKYSISSRMQKFKGCDENKLGNIRFIFDTENLPEKLESELKKQQVDLVVIDTFSDIYTDEMNQINKVRSFMNEYFNLASRYECLFVFNHHTGKTAEDKLPSKHNSIGSTGFEGKARMVMELRQDYEDLGKRHLCIVKGNYLASHYKDRSYELNFDISTGFTTTGKRVGFEHLIKPRLFKPAPNREVEKALVLKLHADKKSSRAIATELKKKGYTLSKSTVAGWIKSVSN